MTPSYGSKALQDQAIRSCGSWQMALHLFSSAEKVDALSFGGAMKVCARHGRWQETISLLEEMSHRSLQRNVVTLSLALNALAQVTRWVEALKLFEDIVETLQPDVALRNSAIKCCQRASQWREALALAEDTDVVGWNSVLNACGRAGEWQRGLEVLHLIKRRGLQSTVVTYGAAMDALQQASEWQQVLELYGSFLQTGLQVGLLGQEINL